MRESPPAPSRSDLFANKFLKVRETTLIGTKKCNAIHFSELIIIDVGLTRAVPVEVKLSRNVRSRSLSVYREKYEPDLSIRLSTRNFGFERGIRSVPLYAASCIGLEA